MWLTRACVSALISSGPRNLIRSIATGTPRSFAAASKVDRAVLRLCSPIAPPVGQDWAPSVAIRIVARRAERGAPGNRTPTDSRQPDRRLLGGTKHLHDPLRFFRAHPIHLTQIGLGCPGHGCNTSEMRDQSSRQFRIDPGAPFQNIAFGIQQRLRLVLTQPELVAEAIAKVR